MHPSSTEQSVMALAAGRPYWFPEIQNQLGYVLDTLNRRHQNCNLVFSLLGDVGGGVHIPFTKLSKHRGKKIKFWVRCS